MEASKLPELVISAIESACASGKRLSWKIQESDRGTLVQLVWKPICGFRATGCSSEKVGSNWSYQKRKSPSRLRRDAQRLQKFCVLKLSTQQLTQTVTPETEDAAVKSDVNLTNNLDPARDLDPAIVDNHDPAKGLNPATVVGTASVTASVTTSVASGDTDQLGTIKSLKPEVGQIVRLDSRTFVHYSRSNGAVRDWDTDTSSLPLLPVLHHGTVAN